MTDEEGMTPNTCPLCGYEGMMPFCKAGQKTYGKCPVCSCEWEEDREEGRQARKDDEKKLAAWTEAAAGWRGGAR